MKELEAAGSGDGLDVLLSNLRQDGSRNSRITIEIMEINETTQGECRVRREGVKDRILKHVEV